MRCGMQMPRFVAAGPLKLETRLNHLRKDALVCTAFVVTRASLVHARAARALSEAAESRRAVAHVPGVRVYCTGCGAVREGKRLFLCRVVVVLWLGRCGGLTRKDGSLPSLRGGPHAVAAPATWTDLLGARAERVPDCSSYLSRNPWSATDSGSSIHPRDSRGSRGG